MGEGEGGDTFRGKIKKIKCALTPGGRYFVPFSVAVWVIQSARGLPLVSTKSRARLAEGPREALRKACDSPPGLKPAVGHDGLRNLCFQDLRNRSPSLNAME